MILPFTKMHGAGNDFVVIDAVKKPVKVNAALAKKLCDRRFGAGCDQLLILEKSKTADFRMRIMNPDGSEVEMCGNGIRCAALFARERKIVKKDDMTVETLAGLIEAVQPPLYVCGHIHEAVGHRLLGKTLAVNAGRLIWGEYDRIGRPRKNRPITYQYFRVQLENGVPERLDRIRLNCTGPVQAVEHLVWRVEDQFQSAVAAD